MSQFTEEELIAKVQDGYLVESVEEMTEGYKKALTVQLTVQADYAPSTNTQVSAHAIIQDELAHANIAYRLLEDLGESKEQLVYGRQPHEFKHPYGFDQPLENWAELVPTSDRFLSWVRSSLRSLRFSKVRSFFSRAFSTTRRSSSTLKGLVT